MEREDNSGHGNICPNIPRRTDWLTGGQESIVFRRRGQANNRLSTVRRVVNDKLLMTQSQPQPLLAVGPLDAVLAHPTDGMGMGSWDRTSHDWVCRSVEYKNARHWLNIDTEPCRPSSCSTRTSVIVSHWRRAKCQLKNTHRVQNPAKKYEYSL